MSQITMKEIAKRAGVSHQTVSRILNNKESLVTEKTRQKVMEIINELDYHPNYLAQSLRSGKRHCIAIAGTGTLGEIDDLSTARLTAGIGEIVDKNKYYLLQIPYEEDMNRNLVKIAKSRMADGLLFFTYPHHYDEFIHSTVPVLEAEKLPFVNLHASSLSFNCHHVGFNAEAAGYLGTRHLVEQGYTDIGIICPIRPGFCDEYWQGYQRALRESGLPVVDLRSNSGELIYARGGYAHGKEIIRRGINQAYILHSDRAALGLVRALEEAGKRVPEDVGIVSCGNMFDDEKIMISRLTSIDTGVKERGRLAADILFNAIDDKYAPAEYQSRIFQPELVVRESSRNNNR